MTLRHMKIFLAVFQTQNITHAAELLCMTQPAVTRAIKEIESYYGVQLFDRIRKKLYITESGKLFYAHAVHISDSFNQLEKSLRNWEEIGVIRIGTTITIGNILLPKVLHKFKQEYPHLQVKATVDTGQNLQKALIDNHIDFAVIEGYIENADLLCRPIAPDRLVLILSPDDPRADSKSLHIEDLTKDSFILRNQGSISRAFVEHIFAKHEISPAPTIESVSTQAIVRAVHEGLGISFLPEQLVKNAISSKFVSTASLVDETFVRENHIVWHKQKFLSPCAQLLMDGFCQLSNSYASD